MNNILELWSLPWHALQRSLANGFGAETPLGGGANPQAPGGCVTAPLTGTSWLMRARLIAAQATPRAYR